MRYSNIKYIYFLLIVITLCSCFRSRTDKEALSSFQNDAEESDIDETIRFTPLNDNERFAYSLEGVQNVRGFRMMNMTLYAVRNNDIEDISELFTWKDVLWFGIQFTDDYRMCFFAVWQRSEIPPHSPSFTHYLYMVDGATGEIKKVMTNLMLPFRASKDGRFVCYINQWRLSDFEKGLILSETEKANIFLYDIENKTMRQFE